MDTPTLLEHRRRRDAYFASEQGPLSSEQRASFTGLAYFEPDPAFVFRLEPERLGVLEPFRLATSSGDIRWMLRWGRVTVPFAEGNTTLELYALEPEEQPATLFVPFRDATSGRETYGLGRYVDAPLEHGVLRLDFNWAYNPTCAYAEGYVCPLPPHENWLTVSVRAGEKVLWLEP